MPAKTGKGDTGYTDLLGGDRVKKDHPMIELVGEIDELTAWIGVARSDTPDIALQEILGKIQNHLSTIMAAVSFSHLNTRNISPEITQNIQVLEGWITTFEEDVKFPHAFIQAGNSKRGAVLNLIRTISRRVERKAVATFSSDDAQYFSIYAYLNRLSTLFYVLWIRIEKGQN